MSSPYHLQDTFDRSHPYLQDMVLFLRSFGLPDDLVYLAFAESEFTDKVKVRGNSRAIPPSASGSESTITSMSAAIP